MYYLCSLVGASGVKILRFDRDLPDGLPDLVCPECIVFAGPDGGKDAIHLEQVRLVGSATLADRPIDTESVDSRIGSGQNSMGRENPNI